MKIMKIAMTFMMMSLPILAFSQAKKPTLMVVPSDAWCVANGYTTTYNVQGKSTQVSDYEKALQSDMDLVNVITKVGELMADRDFPLKDLSSTLRNLNQSEAEDDMTTSHAGSTLAETPLERLLNRAKADIILELSWKVNTLGPKQSVTYNLRGLDAYTNKQVAASQGTGEQSFSSEIPVLLEEAVIKNMDNFTAQLQAHFDDLVEKGREIAFNVRVFNNGSGVTLEKEYNGDELTDIIDAWVAQNTVNHRYNLSDAGETAMHFEQVRIPLYRENGMPMDARQFVNGLRKYLSSSPYRLTSKIITRGLGRADLIIGEK
jgi:hypothetical protein